MAETNGACVISVVIPVYRSALILPILTEEILAAMRSANMLDSFELILINDCSPDNSWTVITEIAKLNSFVKGISLRRNFGQHNATMAGLNQARGDFIVVMDDDMQHPPSAIPSMLNALNAGYDVCYTRYENRQHAKWKKLGSMFNGWVAGHLLGKPKGLYLSSFKAMRRGVAQEVIKYDGPYTYIDGLILDVTSSITTVAIDHKPRLDGEGNYDLRRSLSLWLKMATSFSVLPLRVATYVGLAIAVLSAIMTVGILVQKLVHPDTATGWTSLVSVVLFMGGVQTFCLGIIGEYVGRIYLKLNHKPQFIVASVTEGINES